MDEPLVRVKNYRQYFKAGKSFVVKAVDGVSFELRRGEVFGLVGESGSGKSTVARAIMGIHQPSGGEVYFKDCLLSDRKARRDAHGDIQLNRQCIFQDSAAALNPRMRVKDIIAEPLVINRVHAGKALDARVDELMAAVGLDEMFRNHYPNELSGGQRQRAAIARSIGPNPELVVADEPVAALDVSIQAQIITLFQRLQKEKGFTFLFIAHDLSMVRYLSDRVGVMYAGKLVELAPTEELFANPLHPYTQSLLSAIPLPDPLLERGKTIRRFDRGTPLHGELREIGGGHFVLVHSQF